MISKTAAPPAAGDPKGSRPPAECRRPGRSKLILSRCGTGLPTRSLSDHGSGDPCHRLELRRHGELVVTRRLAPPELTGDRGAGGAREVAVARAQRRADVDRIVVV